MPLRSLAQTKDDAEQLKAAAEQIKTNVSSRIAFAHELHTLGQSTARSSTSFADQAISRANDAIAQTDANAAQQHAIEAKAALEAAIQTGTVLIALVPTGDPKDEWKECRATIDRLDKMLVELRKTGVGLITGILGAAAFLLNVPSTQGTATFATAPDAVKLSIFGIISLMIAVICVADRVHQIWLVAAVERSVELESRLAYQITSRLSRRVSAWRATALGIGIYLVLLIAAALIFWIDMKPSDPFALDSRRYVIAAITGIALLIVGAFARETK